MLKISQRLLIIFILPLIFLIATPKKVNAHELLIFVTPKIVKPDEKLQVTVYLPGGIREDGKPCEAIEFSASIIDSNGSPSSSESSGVMVVDTEEQLLFKEKVVMRHQALILWHINTTSNNKTIALRLYGKSKKPGKEMDDRPISHLCLPVAGAEIFNEQTGDIRSADLRVTAAPKIKFMHGSKF